MCEKLSAREIFRALTELDQVPVCNSCSSLMLNGNQKCWCGGQKIIVSFGEFAKTNLPKICSDIRREQIRNLPA